VRLGSISSVAAARAAATQRVGTSVRRAIFRLQQQKQQQLRCREHGSAQTDPLIGHFGPPQLVSIRETRQTAISDLRKARASAGSTCREKISKLWFALAAHLFQFLGLSGRLTDWLQRKTGSRFCIYKAHIALTGLILHRVHPTAALNYLFV